VHTGRDSDLDADALTDPITNANAVANANADADADSDADPDIEAVPYSEANADRSHADSDRPDADSDSDADRPHADSDADARSGAGPLELRDRRAVTALVATPAAHTSDLWVLSQHFTHRASQRPGPHTVHDDDAVESGEEGIVEVAMQAFQGGFDPLAMQIQCRRHALSRAAAHLLCLDIPWRGARDRLMDNVHVVGRDHEPRAVGFHRDPARASTDLHDAARASQRARTCPEADSRLRSL